MGWIKNFFRPFVDNLRTIWDDLRTLGAFLGHSMSFGEISEAFKGAIEYFGYEIGCFWAFGDVCRKSGTLERGDLWTFADVLGPF